MLLDDVDTKAMDDNELLNITAKSFMECAADLAYSFWKIEHVNFLEDSTANGNIDHDRKIFIESFSARFRKLSEVSRHSDTLSINKFKDRILEDIKDDSARERFYESVTLLYTNRNDLKKLNLGEGYELYLTQRAANKGAAHLTHDSWILSKNSMIYTLRPVAMIALTLQETYGLALSDNTTLLERETMFVSEMFGDFQGITNKDLFFAGH